jgi:hypothetical protein
VDAGEGFGYLGRDEDPEPRLTGVGFVVCDASLPPSRSCWSASVVEYGTGRKNRPLLLCVPLREEDATEGGREDELCGLDMTKKFGRPQE